MNVAQYRDQWVETKNGSLRARYLRLQDCKGTKPVCGALMPAKEWTRRFKDPSASHQRWYCVCCETRYMTKFGMLAEIHRDGISTFMLAEVTNWDVDDARAMFLEKEGIGGEKATSPEELWKLIPNFVPRDSTDILRPLEPYEKVWDAECDRSTISKLINTDGLKDAPKWKWDDLFAILSS